MLESSAATKSAIADANYKETVEQILVAFILAFIFRAFIVEAFVIPTGSMATTLYGAHMRLQCPDCGYVYDVGYQGPESESGDDIDVPAEIDRPAGIRCPNCGSELAGSSKSARILEPIRFGDRILVLKYLYLFSKPQRWDVVVFKSPSEPKHHFPSDAEYPQNYIKRLIATPNESAVILDGDIYIGEKDARGLDESGQVMPDVGKKFVIQRKPEYVQDRLWRIAYDNDFIPRHLANSDIEWHQPWQKADGTGWNVGSDAGPSRIFRFDNSTGSGELFFNPDANRNIYPLREWMAYDQLGSGRGNWVSDVKLSCVYTRSSGDGPLRITLSKLDQAFIAEIKPGSVTLYRSTVTKSSDTPGPDAFAAGTPAIMASKALDVKPGVPMQIDFMNYDYRVSLKIDGKEIIGQEYDPDVKKLWTDAVSNERSDFARPEIRIAGANQSATIEHLSLWRDIYYGNTGDARDYKGRTVAPFWGSPRNVMHLGPAEYFVLGDNSPISGDARYWGDPVKLPQEGIDIQGGRVPEEFMLGKAFFVYWPAGYPLKVTSINGVPDFGEMRFIH